MGVSANGPTSVEVTKHIDGIMCEIDRIAGWLQYLGLARPMVLLPYFVESSSYDTTPRETEEKTKTALSMGYCNSRALDVFGGCLHSIGKYQKEKPEVRGKLLKNP